MPFSTGSGELQIVGSQGTSSLGDAKGPPAVVQWKWYYSLPGLVFLVLAVLPLVFAKENRNLRAWAALIPLLIILVVWNWMRIIFDISSSNSESIGVMIIALATAWTVFWSLSARFQTHSKTLNFMAAAVVILVIMSAVFATNGIMEANGLISTLIFQLIFAVTWLISMSLSSRCCRKTYSPKRFMAWLFLWTLLIPAGVMFIFSMGSILIFSGGSLSIIPFIIIGMLISSGMVGFILYLLNVPFMLLVFNNSIYDERFRKTFGLPAGEMKNGEAIDAEVV